MFIRFLVLLWVEAVTVSTALAEPDPVVGAGEVALPWVLLMLFLVKLSLLLPVHRAVLLVLAQELVPPVVPMDY
jgi:hypothetical protein